MKIDQPSKLELIKRELYSQPADTFGIEPAKRLWNFTTGAVPAGGVASLSVTLPLTDRFRAGEGLWIDALMLFIDNTTGTASITVNGFGCLILDSASNPFLPLGSLGVIPLSCEANFLTPTLKPFKRFFPYQELKQWDALQGTGNLDNLQPMAFFAQAQFSNPGAAAQTAGFEFYAEYRKIHGVGDE